MGAGQFVSDAMTPTRPNHDVSRSPWTVWICSGFCRSNNFRAAVVYGDMMGTRGPASRYHLGVITLILLTVGVSVVRPVLRQAGHLPAWSLSRAVFLSEAAADDQVQVPSPTRMTRQVPLTVAAPMITEFKIYRQGFVPIPVRRLRLPAHSTNRSLPFH